MKDVTGLKLPVLKSAVRISNVNSCGYASTANAEITHTFQSSLSCFSF